MQALFLDDEAHRTRLYRQHLATDGWDIELCTTIDETRAFLDQEEPRRFELAVIDLQMGRPDDMDEQAWETFCHLPGLWFLAQRRAFFENQRTAILILTNKNPNDFTEALHANVVSKITKVPIGLFRKTFVPARSLPSRVKQLLGQPHGQLMLVQED